jgi:transcriptional regulator with XRE-family HTH domain
MDFVERIKSLMKAKQINRKMLAERSGIPYTTVCGIISRGDGSDARLRSVVKIADYFHVSLDWLVYGNEQIKAGRDGMLDVARLALECSDAMKAMAGMTNELGRALIELSKQSAEREEGTQ